MSTAIDLYKQDFYAWTREQAAKLRARRLAEIDIEHLAEEIESMGRSEKRELINRLAALMAHLLRWRLQKDLRHSNLNSWRAAIEEQRLEVVEMLADNPSLRHGLEGHLADAYRKAVLQRVRETGLDKRTFPAVCLFTLEQVLDGRFWPD